MHVGTRIYRTLLGLTGIEEHLPTTGNVKAHQIYRRVGYQRGDCIALQASPRDIQAIELVHGEHQGSHAVFCEASGQTQIECLHLEVVSKLKTNHVIELKVLQTEFLQMPAVCE